MTRWLKLLAKRMNGDRAESSIMQTVTVATSAILIAAGTLTMPGIINGQKENTARTQLANMAFAQEAWAAANGFVNTNFLPTAEDGSVYPTGHPKAGQKVPNLSKWKYPYNFSTFAIKTIVPNFNCYKGEYVVTAKLSTGKTFSVTSSNATAVEASKLDVPLSCRPGYVPDVDSIPTVPDRVAAPTGVPTNITISADRATLVWNPVTCAAGNTPAYQIRAKVGTAAEKSGAWSSSADQSLDFLAGAHKVTGKSTVFNVAAKCRNNKSGTLSNAEIVTPVAQRLTFTA